MKPIELLTLLVGLVAPPAGHDHAGPGPAPCRRASRVIRYHVALDLPGVTPAEARGAARAAFAEWAALCDICPVEVADPAEADLRLVTDDIDGPLGLIALAQFPCEASITLVRLDRAEAWTPGLLRQTIGHEAGHCLGIDHQHRPGVPALMAPYADGPDTAAAPAESDREQAVARYGRPR